MVLSWPCSLRSFLCKSPFLAYLAIVPRFPRPCMALLESLFSKTAGDDVLVVQLLIVESHFLSFVSWPGGMPSMWCHCLGSSHIFDLL